MTERCKWFDEVTEICVNDSCPMCADFCPVPYTRDVCKWEEEAVAAWNRRKEIF